MEDIILKKLGLTKRGALNILSDKYLCEKIIKEDITEIKEASYIYNISYTKLFNLIKNGKLSYISNSMLRNGCKKWIFNLELECFINDNVSHVLSITHSVNEIYKVIDELAKKILNSGEYNIFKMHNEGEALEKVSYRFNLSRPTASYIYGRSVKKLKTYFVNLKKYNELSELNYVLLDENERLKIANRLLKNKVNNHAEKYVIEDWRQFSIYELGISTRLKGILIECEISRVEDLIKFIKINGIAHFRKYRKVGEGTFNELTNLINHLVSSNNTGDIELIKALNE